MEIAFKIKATQKDVFDLAIKTLFLLKNEHNIIGYKIENNTLKLSTYCQDKTKVDLLPYQYNLEQTIQFVWGWYEQSEVKYATPDTDGSAGKAFEIKISEEWNFLLEIKPIWFVYGK